MRRILLSVLFVAVALPGLASADPVDAKTARTWKAKCASCHGEDGKGNTEQSKKMGGLKDLSNADVQKKLTDERFKEVIAKGTKDKDKKGEKPAEMDAYADLQPATVDALLKLVRSFAK